MFKTSAAAAAADNNDMARVQVEAQVNQLTSSYNHSKSYN